MQAFDYVAPKSVDEKMATSNITPTNPADSKPASVKSRFSVFGLVLGVPGFVISISTTLLIYFIAVAGGGLDIMLTNAQWSTIVSILYCGLFIGIVGGILGVVGFIRGENKTEGLISISLTLPMLCICSTAVIFSAFY